MRYGLLAGAVVAVLLALAGTASAQTPAFTFNQLPKWSGGEPSIAADPTGSGDVYVVAPQSIPSVLNGIFQQNASDPQDGTSGQSFSPCGNLIDPGGPAAQTYNPGDGTLVSKPVVGPDGSVYVEFSTTDPSGNGGYGDVYMAVAKGGCNGQFANYRVFADKDADF